MTYQWVAASLTTGNVLDDLSTFVPDYPLRSTLSNYDTATGTLYLDGASPDWARSIKAGASVLACYDDTDPQLAIQWAGYVTKTDPDSATDSVKLDLVTLEGYLTRRYVPDVTYTAAAWGRNAIVADLVSKYVAAGAGGLPGVPLSVVQVGGGGPAPTVDLVWQNADNATVLARMSTLFAQLGGEYAITWAWSGAPGQGPLVPTLTVGDRIGVSSGTGVPAVTLDQPGPIVSVNMPIDYGDGAGANHVTAYSNGSGTYTPYSAPSIATVSDDRPVFEYRWSPASSETNTTVLGKYATQALGLLSPGARPLSVVLALEELTTGRRYGTDWNRGDDVGYHVDPCLAFPDGLDGTARVIVADLGATTLTPTFAQPEIYVEAAA
jgi:hypothetical protein